MPLEDTVLVERIRNAGAIPIGKTNVPEFGMGSHTYNRVYRTTLNPYDTTKSAGGSSGGAAAAVTAGMLPIADGSDLGGVRLTDDPADPGKFIFPQGATLPAGAYLLVYANNPDGTPGFHLGFNLNQSGDSVYLFNSVANGGALIDSVTFGAQITDLSIGRLPDGSWGLTIPTFGSANKAAPTGNPAALRINEWLAIAETPFDNDFIELYNADSLPVNLGGLYLSDEILSWPTRDQIAPLSFVPGFGYIRFIADSDPQQGAAKIIHDVGHTGLFPISTATACPMRMM